MGGHMAAPRGHTPKEPVDLQEIWEKQEKDFPISRYSDLTTIPIFRNYHSLILPFKHLTEAYFIG